MLLRAATVSSMLASAPLFAQPSACPDGRWSEPIELRTADHRPVYLEPAPVARLGTRFISVASPSFVWRTPTEFMTVEIDTAGIRSGRIKHPWNMSRGGFVFGRDGLAAPLDQPPAGSWMVHPRLFEVDSGSVLAVWGQDTAWTNGFDTHRIWSSRLRKGAWETPEARSRLYAGIHWLGDVSTHARMGTPAYAATLIDSGTAYLLAGLYRDHRWVDKKIPVRMTGPGVHAASYENGMTVMLSGFSFGQYGVAMLPFRFSGDSLVTDSPIFVDTDRGVPAGGDSNRRNFSPRSGAITRINGDSLLAVWTYEDLTAGRGVFRLRTEVSSDGGMSWTRTLPIELGERADDLQLLITAQRDRHLIYRSQAIPLLGGEGSLRHLIWRDGRWHRARSIGNHSVASRLGSGSSDEGIVLYWTKSSMQYGIPVPQTVASWWTPGC